MAGDVSEKWQSQIHEPLEHRSRHSHSNVSDKYFCTDSSLWAIYPLQANTHPYLHSFKVSSYQNWAVSIEQGAGWAPESVWTLRRRRKLCFLSRSARSIVTGCAVTKIASLSVGCFGTEHIRINRHSFIQYSVWRQVQSLLQNDASI